MNNHHHYLNSEWWKMPGMNGVRLMKILGGEHDGEVYLYSVTVPSYLEPSTRHVKRFKR